MWSATHARASSQDGQWHRTPVTTTTTRPRPSDLAPISTSPLARSATGPASASSKGLAQLEQYHRPHVAYPVYRQEAYPPATVSQVAARTAFVGGLEMGYSPLLSYTSTSSLAPKTEMVTTMAGMSAVSGVERMRSSVSFEYTQSKGRMSGLLATQGCLAAIGDGNSVIERAPARLLTDFEELKLPVEQISAPASPSPKSGRRRQRRTMGEHPQRSLVVENAPERRYSVLSTRTLGTTTGIPTSPTRPQMMMPLLSAGASASLIPGFSATAMGASPESHQHQRHPSTPIRPRPKSTSAAIVDPATAAARRKSASSFLRGGIEFSEVLYRADKKEHHKVMQQHAKRERDDARRARNARVLKVDSPGRLRSAGDMIEAGKRMWQRLFTRRVVPPSPLEAGTRTRGAVSPATRESIPATFIRKLMRSRTASRKSSGDEVGVVTGDEIGEVQRNELCVSPEVLFSAAERAVQRGDTPICAPTRASTTVRTSTTSTGTKSTHISSSSSSATRNNTIQHDIDLVDMETGDENPHTAENGTRAQMFAPFVPSQPVSPIRKVSSPSSTAPASGMTTGTVSAGGERVLSDERVVSGETRVLKDLTNESLHGNVWTGSTDVPQQQQVQPVFTTSAASGNAQQPHENRNTQHTFVYAKPPAPTEFPFDIRRVSKPLQRGEPGFRETLGNINNERAPALFAPQPAPVSAANEEVATQPLVMDVADDFTSPFTRRTCAAGATRDIWRSTSSTASSTNASTAASSSLNGAWRARAFDEHEFPWSSGVSEGDEDEEGDGTMEGYVPLAGVDNNPFFNTRSQSSQREMSSGSVISTTYESAVEDETAVIKGV
ncbi:uncharacterized protein V1518DRAFT_416428 [Limtongia smithiae]|uniref:uncharacterized protein n=1 Tax=Limtongia smithiae TaxID=1125753 RepID=UPI0034CEDBB8